MPGASLWLLPPSSDSITKTLTTIIEEDVPKLLDEGAPSFEPHITLTSDVDLTNIHRPQQWLQDLISQHNSASPKPIAVEFQQIGTAQRFTKKVYIQCQKEGEKHSSLRALAAICRQSSSLCGDKMEAERWVREAWDPHVSLLYSAIEVSDKDLQEVARIVNDKGVSIGEHAQTDGWSGGRVWLVDTSKPIKDWTMTASLTL